MKRLFCCFVLLLAIGCSQSPTGPSQAPSIAGQLSWNVRSTTCAPVTPPSPEPAFSAATITPEPDGSVTASWPHTMNNRSMTLYARFVRENGAWAMCSWDVADV